MDWTWAGLFGLEGPDRSTQATSRIPTVTSRDSNQQTVKFVKTILTLTRLFLSCKSGRRKNPETFLLDFYFDLMFRVLLRVSLGTCH